MTFIGQETQADPVPSWQESRPETLAGEGSLVLSWPTTLFMAAVHIVALLGGIRYFSWSGLLVAVVLNFLTISLGISLGYHRLLSHRSLRVPKFLEYMLAVCGALAAQRGPIFVTATHRRHHAFSDQEQDPHSPWQRGFWWGHLLWLLYVYPPEQQQQINQRYAADLLKDPVYRFLDRRFLALQLLLGILLFWGGGWSWVVYGVFVRLVVGWHVTWLNLSATHLWGRQWIPDDRHHARNLWWVAWLTYGEGWHSNHHTYPHSARIGLTWWQVDPTYGVIWLLQNLGLADQVKLPASQRH
ncbi:MAG: fatty acid desaturase [Cyanobacteriota bacterium]|nr:fatty acid desaturase [Cyanobacteriota bacterium]